jgi:hypothetical protein
MTQANIPSPPLPGHRLAGALVLAEVSEADESNGSAANDPLLWLYSSRLTLMSTETDRVIVTVLLPAAAALRRRLAVDLHLLVDMLEHLWPCVATHVAVLLRGRVRSKRRTEPGLREWRNSFLARSPDASDKIGDDP